MTKCACFGSGGNGLSVDVVVGIYGFALLTAVASRVAYAMSPARRNLGTPINCTLYRASPIPTRRRYSRVHVVEVGGIEPPSEQLISHPNYDHLRCQRIRGTPGADKGMSWGELYRGRVSTTLFFFVATVHGTSPS